MSEQEQWRPIPGYPDYHVSSMGRVRSHRGPKPRILTPQTDSHGYLSVKVRAEINAPLWRRVHRLVTLTFLGECPPELQVRHLDGDQKNNVLSNLTYGTAAENADDLRRHRTPATHCQRGHSYAEFTMARSDGGRQCRKCHAIRTLAAYHRSRAAVAS